MDGAVFGSYSVTEFTDLYYLNVRYNHHYSFFLELSPDGVVGLKQGKIDGIKKANDTFLMGILCDNIDNVSIERDIVEYFETKHVRDINYLIDKKKQYIYFAYDNAKVLFSGTKDLPLYISENRSFSTVCPNGYREVRPNMVYSIPLFKDRTFDCDSNDIV